MNVLEINNLTKHFANVKALDDVSLRVEEGAICGLLGPNGAGKTTLLRIINGILAFDSGEVTVLGQPVSLRVASEIGYMPEERGLYDKMRVEDQILYFGQLHGGKPADLRPVMKEYMAMFNLEGQERRRVKELSKGNQQKVQIISTLVHSPKLVILDEPFSGFDPINGQILTQLISRLHDKGTTIILSSHNMPAIEEMCSDIALINHGRLLVADTISELKEANKDGALLLTTRKPLNEGMLRDSGIIESIEASDPHQWRKGSAYRIVKKEGVSNSALISELALQSEILHFEESLPSLNDIFLKYTNNAPATPQGANA